MESSASPPIPSSSPLQLSGIPFSWEKLPGIPKKHSSSSNQIATLSSKTSLPPPPPSSSTTKKHSKKPPSTEQPQWDPFVAALAQCSSDPDSGQRYRDHGKDRNVWTVSRVPRRSIGDRLGFVISLHGDYGSCKVRPAVADSIVYAPAGARRRTAYGYGT